MAILGLWQIGRPEFWHDELVTLDVVTRSLWNVAGLLENVDAVHGLYYLIMHLWTEVFGTSRAALRLPSALAMIGAAAVIALIGRRLFNKWAGVLGGLTFALIPMTTRFAQEARSYAFTILFAALVTWLLLRAVDRGGLRAWCWYAMSLATMGAFNLVAMSIVAGHAVGLGVMRADGDGTARQPWRPFAGAVAASALLIAPLAYLGSTQAFRQVAWVPKLDLWHIWPQVFTSTAVAVAILVLAALAPFGGRLRRVGFIAAVATVPLLAIWLISLVEFNYFFSKYFLFTVPAWAVLAGAGLAALRWRIASTAAVALVAVLALPGQEVVRARLGHGWYTYPQAPLNQPLDYRGAAKVIADNYQPGDGVVYPRGGYWWYMADVGTAYYLPDNVRMRDIYLHRPAAEVDDLYAPDCWTPETCVGTEPRIWLVMPGDPTTDPLSLMTPEQSGALRAHYTVEWLANPSGFTIALLRRSS
jgi:mannosyltransferase